MLFGPVARAPCEIWWDLSSVCHCHPLRANCRCPLSTRVGAFLPGAARLMDRFPNRDC